MEIKRFGICLVMFFCTLLSISAKNALVIIVHGSPSKQWNETALSLERNVQNELKKRNINDFEYVKIAMMEFAQPSVATVVKQCESRKVDHIYVIPLFIAPSSHSEEDIPVLLGLKSNEKIKHALEEEKTQLVNTSIPLTVGPTLSYSTVIQEVVADRIKELSVDSSKESFVLVAHGDANYYPFWNTLMEETGKYVSSKTGIKFGGFTYLQMGQNFNADMYPVLEKASHQASRILVQGIYLSEGIKRMAVYAQSKGNDDKRYTLPVGVTVEYGTKGLLPDNRYFISNWIADRVAEFARH